MSDAAAEMVTVFRSAEDGAQDEAANIVDMLAEAGLNAMLLTEDYPGVPPGSVEVRVPEAEEEQALDLIDAQVGQTMEGSTSHGFDLVELYRGAGTSGEVESVSIRAVLDANHIPSVLVGPMQMPNLPFRVMVPQVFLDAAQQVLDEAAAAGPAVADAAGPAAADAAGGGAS
ncbi:MAG: hypothetical protein FJW31_18850 [Acidobacteria bacterium]|nr:hypothetical protein [Acidobacteriota bacterium]